MMCVNKKKSEQTKEIEQEQSKRRKQVRPEQTKEIEQVTKPRAKTPAEKPRKIHGEKHSAGFTVNMTEGDWH